MKDDDEPDLPWLDRPVKELDSANHNASESGQSKTMAARHREGFLLRKGDWTGFWRRRYFKLFNRQLTYFRSDTDETAAQTWNVETISDVVEEEKIKPNAFRLILHDGSFVHLCGFSHHDSAKWVSDLRAEIENVQLKEEQEFEVLSADSFDSRSELVGQFKGQFFTISSEKGLPSQNFRCFDCQAPIGIIYGPPRVCAFTGRYYCTKCHDNTMSVIPSRIIFNWDFSTRPVSRKVKQFLSRVQHDPIIELMEINSSLYSHVPALDRVRTARKRLKKMELYLVSCPDGKEIWSYYIHGRKYLSENIDLYSVTDLLEFTEETLEGTVKTCLTLGRKHILDCERCRMKGFFCEICGSDELIFPFDFDVCETCPVCQTCFHRSCFDPEKTGCPKCARIEARLAQRAKNSSAGDQMN